MKCFSLKYIGSVSFSALFLLIHATYPATTPADQPKIANWTIMVYAQADYILNTFAIKSFNAISKIGSNENLNIIVQWNQPRRKGMWRYKIDKNHMTLLANEKTKPKATFSNDIIEFVDFTVKNYPAKKYGFVFWSHGIGIVDPAWNQLQEFAMQPAALTYSSQTRTANITKSFSTKRGILFDLEKKAYMNNQELTATLAHITNNILHKKFNFIGMDACLMAMLEMMYELRPYAKYFVSSEEVELAPGWNYPPFLHIAKTSKVKTKHMVHNIVTSYEAFYQKKTQFYTQSAINLENIDFLKNNLDHVVNNIGLCLLTNRQKTDTAIKRARKLCLQFSTPCYVDLHSFYSELYKQLTTLELQAQQESITKPHIPRARRSIMIKQQPSPTTIFINSQPFKDLKQTLATGIELIDYAVIANVKSKYLAHARGISIYYPEYKIDPSYLKTSFAHESLWTDFLQQQIQ